MSRDNSADIKKGIEAFIHHVESLENADDDGFSREYASIQDIQMRHLRDNVNTMDVGQMESNLRKNRYKDIVPYDNHRIVLTALEGDQTSDYINASKIVGVGGTGDYIASQGPLTGTVNDFWRMIWEYDIEIIFMACRLVEMKKIKCSRYWSDVGTSEEFGDITVFTESEEEIITECVRRNLRVTKGNEVHNVVQFHYCGWPDHGIPANPTDIHDVIGIMRQTKCNSKAPILVHCSAGCGRTGAIIAIDYVWTLLEEGKIDETFSLYKLTCHLREQRVSFIQTPDQYALVNKVLKTLCEERLTKMASHTYENVVFNKEPSTDGVVNQISEDNDYEDVWSVAPGSQATASVLDLHENSAAKHINFGSYEESKKELQTAEKESDEMSSVYANVAEIQREIQVDRAQDHEQQQRSAATDEKKVHKTFIRVGSISTAETAQSPDVKDVPVCSPSSPSGSSFFHETNPLASTKQANLTDVQDSLAGTTAITSEHSTSSTRQNKLKLTASMSNSNSLSLSSSDTVTTEKSSKQKHVGFGRFWHPRAGKGDQEISVSKTSDFNAAKNETVARRSQPEKARSLASTATYVSKKTSLASLPPQYQAPLPSSNKTGHVFEGRKGSSLKFHPAFPSPISFSSQRTTSSPHTRLYPVPTQSTKVKVATGTDVIKFVHRPDNTTQTFNPDDSARRRNSSTESSDNQTARQPSLETRGKSHASSGVVMSANTQFKGFVRLNSKKSSSSGAKNHPKH